MMGSRTCGTVRKIGRHLLVLSGDGVFGYRTRMAGMGAASVEVSLRKVVWKGHEGTGNMGISSLAWELDDDDTSEGLT